MQKREITSKQLKELVSDIYGVLNLMSILNLVIFFVIALALIKFTSSYEEVGKVIALVIIGVILGWFCLKSQFKKFSYKIRLGKNLSLEDWENFNREMDKTTARSFGYTKSLDICVLTENFLFFPSRKRLEIIKLENLSHLEKTVKRTRDEDNPKRLFMEIKTKAGKNYLLDFNEELYKLLGYRLTS